MKFRLSTLFLVVALVAALSAWAVERQKRQRESRNHQLQDIRVTEAGKALRRIPYNQTVAIAALMNRRLIRNPNSRITKQLIFDIMICWISEHEIERAGHDAKAAAGIVLKVLNCKTPDEFFELMDAVKIDQGINDPAIATVIRDKQSRTKLSEFVERALKLNE